MAGRRRGAARAAIQYEWTNVSDTVASLDLAEGAAVLGVTHLVIGVASTIRRLRGRVFAQLDATAIDERAVIAVGLLVSTQEAMAVGITAVPEPGSDRDDNWMWTGHLMVSSLAEGSVIPDALFDRLVIDSKAQRRMRTGDVLAFVGEIVASSDQGGSVDLMYSFDVLQSA